MSFKHTLREVSAISPSNDVLSCYYISNLVYLLNKLMRTWIYFDSLIYKFDFIRSHNVKCLSHLLVYFGSFTLKRQRGELIIKDIFFPADGVKL